MGRRRVYADTAARQRAYRVRVAEERTSAREAVLDRIRDDPEEGARWLLQQLGSEVASDLRWALDTLLDADDEP